MCVAGPQQQSPARNAMRWPQQSGLGWRIIMHDQPPRGQTVRPVRATVSTSRILASLLRMALTV